MKSRPVTLLLFIFLSIDAFGQGGRVQLEGVVSGMPHVRAVELILSNGFLLEGPAPVRDGQWSLSMHITQPHLALLSFLSDVSIKDSQEAPIYRYNVPLFLAAGTVRVETKDVLSNTKVLGSEATDDYNQLQAAAAPYEAEIQRWRALSGDPAFAGDQKRQVFIGRKIDSLAEVFRERVYGRFLERKIASPLTPHVLNAYWNLHGEPDRMLRFLVNMPARYRYPFINSFRDELEQVAGVWTGQAAPDFSLRDTAGQVVALSSLRGKYVLLDFWASWCVPCRLENPNLTEAFAYFKHRNFTVVGVAVERERHDRQLWLKAIREDSLPGTQLTDFKYFDSPVIRKYAIQSIPQNVLIGPDGKIVARNLSGEHLWAVLDRELPAF